MSVALHHGDCLDVLPTVPRDAAIVSDPPYGMKWDTDSTRFSGGMHGAKRYESQGRVAPRVSGDAFPFDPSPWLAFKKVVLWGANHYAQQLPVGTTLVWIKRSDENFGKFLSDCELGWMKGGYGVYAFRKQFTPPSRAKEAGGWDIHPTQKPVALMKWCLERLKLKPGATVFDPYMGSGTTGVAAVEMGLNFIGCEIDAGHFATASRRIEAARTATPLFAEAAP